jgi:hypothetical protein
MSSTLVIERIAGRSARVKARIAGVFEALEGLASAFGEVVILGRLVVSGNAAATAANILGHQGLFWLGFGLSIAGVAFHTIWVALFYVLFRPVNRTLSLVAAFVGLIVCAMQAVTALLYLAPILVLQGGNAASSFTPGQAQGLAFVFLRLNSYAFDVDLVFFGLWCALTGYLIFRSTFLPRVLGILLGIDGLGWMMYVYPPFALHVFPLIGAASAIAEIPLQLWLIAMGVNPQRWKEQAAAAEVHA